MANSKKGTLKRGESGRRVKSRTQAVAIGLLEAGKKRQRTEEEIVREK